MSGETFFVIRAALPVPDWSVVTDETARAALTDAMAISGRARKWAELTKLEEDVWISVLMGFVVTGASTSRETLRQVTGKQAAELDAALRSLAGRDMIVLGGDGEVGAAYPFSGEPTRHSVKLYGSTPYALCAIDALGVGAMIRRPVEVLSSCAFCDRPISVTTADDSRRLETVSPEGAVVWSGIHYADNCAATSGCALKLFFCSDAHLERWRVRSDAPGHRLSIEAAFQVGRALFGPLLAAQPA